MAILREEVSREERRRRLMEEAMDWPEAAPAAEPRLRLAELPRREAASCTPNELVATSWENEPAVPGQGGESRGIVPTRDSMLIKAKGDFSTLTPDGRAVVDTNRLIRSPEVKRTLAVLEGKIQEPRSSQAENRSFQNKK